MAVTSKRSIPDQSGTPKVVVVLKPDFGHFSESDIPANGASPKFGGTAGGAALTVSHGGSITIEGSIDEAAGVNGERGSPYLLQVDRDGSAFLVGWDVLGREGRAYHGWRVAKFRYTDEEGFKTMEAKVGESEAKAASVGRQVIEGMYGLAESAVHDFRTEFSAALVQQYLDHKEWLERARAARETGSKEPDAKLVSWTDRVFERYGGVQEHEMDALVTYLEKILKEQERK